MKPLLIALVVLALVVPAPLAAQVRSDVWREFAEKIDVGAELNVRLQSGQRFRATFVGTRPDAILLQPKTRVPVPVQPVPYDQIVSLERRQGGVGAGKAAAIGVATGVGAFLGILLIMFAAIDD